MNNSDEYIKVDDKTIQMPVVVMENNKGTTVNLFGTIHIASPKYYYQVYSELNKSNDVVLYEWIKKEGKQTLKDKLIFINTITINKLYGNLSNAINDSTKKKLSKIFRKIIKKNPDKEWDYEKYKQVLLDQAKVVSQSEGIDYAHLPELWEHADITTKEITKKTNIFSRQNIKYLWLNIWASLFWSKFFLKRIAKNFFSGIKSIKTSKSPLDELNILREQKVLDKISDYEQTKSKIWVFYGSAHLENLENSLKKKWYLRKNIFYMDAIRKVPLAA